MKVYKTLEELQKDSKGNRLVANGDIEICFDLYWPELNIEARNIDARNIKAGDIEAWNIKAGDIEAWNIKAGSIIAGNINAENINAGGINAGGINAWSIKAQGIDARNIEAEDIEAEDINAENISYYAYCIAYGALTCQSIKGRRPKSKHFCLDSEIVIKK